MFGAINLCYHSKIVSKLKNNVPFFNSVFQICARFFEKFAFSKCGKYEKYPCFTEIFISSK